MASVSHGRRARRQEARDGRHDGVGVGVMGGVPGAVDLDDPAVRQPRVEG